MSGFYNTGEIMKAYGIRPTKSLGQNFLNDLSVVERITDTGELTPEDGVIEIGPGLGVMTQMMAKKAGYVVAVEIDQHLMPVLEPLAAALGNCTIINKDIMQMDVKREIIDEIFAKKGVKKVKVVANLPYYITTPIIMNLLENYSDLIDTMVFMVQKEVAERMCAGPGGKDYGAMTVTTQYFSEPKLAFIVPPSCFTPRPGVDSAVVRLKIRENPPFELTNKEYFFKIIKASFAQRRKTLVNGLTNAPYTGVNKEKVLRVLSEMGKDELIRGETLSPNEFAILSNALLR